MTKKAVVVIGIGEIGRIFAQGFLCLGHPVYPVTREQSAKGLARQLPEPKLVLIAVGEADLAQVLGNIPKAWRKRLVLVQNELLPDDFQHLDRVTVVSVWFEKKPGQLPKVILPSPAHGPRAELLASALASLHIPVRVIAQPREMLFELVAKNLYILTSNIAGIHVGGDVAELWAGHREFARAVANDVIALQEALTGSRFNNDQLITALETAFAGDPAHQCTGRSAPARLRRALQHADRLGLELPTLRWIAEQHLPMEPE